MTMLNSCIKDMSDDFIRRKWKVIKVIPKSQKGYWEMETDVLDLTNLTASESEDNQRYLQNITGRKLIKFMDSSFYMEVLTVSIDKLMIGLHGIDSKTDRDYLIAEFNCEPIND